MNMNKKIKLSIGLILGVFSLFGFFAVATPASAATCSTAILNGTVITGTPPAQAHFVYGTNYNTVLNGGGTSTPTRSYYTQGSFPIQENISGLTESTTYYFQLIVTNNYGTTYGGVNNFTTLTCQATTYTVSTSAGAGGTISPSSQQVNSGNITNFKITANSGYTISSATGCNGHLSGSTYTTGAVYSDCTVYAYFNQIPASTYTVSTSAGSGGYFSPTSREVTAGNTATFSVYANSGYSISGVSGCNGHLSGSTYTTGAVYSDCTVYAYFSQNQTQNPTVNLTASPSSINSGEGSNLSWNSDNTDYCSASWTTSTATSGDRMVYPTSTRTYSIICYGTNGRQSSDSVTVNVNEINNNEVTVDISADDRNISDGDSTTIRWDSDNADYCNRTGGSNGWARNNVSTSGHFDTGDLTSDKTYRIICYNDNDSATDSVTVSVDENNTDNVSVDIRADDVDISSGDSTKIRWDSDGADYCTASNGTNGWSGSKNTSGTFSTGSLTYTTTYTITCRNYNNSDSATDSVTVYVQNQQINYPPTVVLSADQSNLSYNGATTVRWSTTNATSCYASGGSNGWAGTKSIGPASFYTASLSSSKTYVLVCSNNYGSATATKFIYVSAPINNNPIPPTSLVLINSSIDRNQPIVPTIDNTNPRPGDEINYTVSYQNIGTGSITNLVLQMNLPYEVDYISSNPSNPIFNGNSLTFNLGTLKANGQGTVTVRVRVRDNIPAGTSLNFPATLSYTDPSGRPQSVSANVTAQVWTEPTSTEDKNVSLGANVFGAGFFPTNIFGWLLLIILALLLIAVIAYLLRYIFGYQPLLKKTTTTTTNQPAGKKTTTTTEHQ
jgi:uncharacterized repeat protein (TIGR01451 family)